MLAMHGYLYLLCSHFSICIDTDLWGAGVDPGGIYTCEPKQPPRLGDVCVGVLFCHDLPLAHRLRSWGPQEQWRVGRSGKYVGVCKTRINQADLRFST